MTVIRVGGTIDASAAVLFSHVADYSEAPQFIDGLASLVPTGEQTTGEGAEFDAEMHVGHKVYETTVVIAAYEEQRLVRWAMATGQERSVTFTLKPDGDRTLVVLEVSYERPGGFGGVLLGPIVEETVRAKAHSSLRKLRDRAT